MRAIHRDQSGSVLVETALGAAIVLAVALPFASLVSYAASATRDLAAAHTAARLAARGGDLTAAEVSYACGDSADATEICTTPLARGTYIAARRDTQVVLPFGVTLGTAARAVARVE